MRSKLPEPTTNPDPGGPGLGSPRPHASGGGLGWLGGSLVAHAFLVAVVLLGERSSAETQAPALGEQVSDSEPIAERWIDVSSLAAAVPRAFEPAEAEPALEEADRAADSPVEPVPRTSPGAGESDRRKTAPAGAQRPRPTTRQAATKAPSRPRFRGRTVPNYEPSDSTGTAPPRTAPEGEDWLRVEDQLPATEPTAATSAGRSVTPDPLVERLLSAERRKAAAATRRRTEPTGSSTATEPASSQEPGAPPAASVAEVNTPQDLGDRFTRAVTEAERSNPVWAKHPLGSVGRVRVRIALKDGTLVEPEFEGEPNPLLVRLVQKTLFLLRRGTFALPFSERASGSQWFEITVRLSTVDDVNRYAYERPTRERPGRAYFVLPDGRLFEALVNPNAER